MDLMKAEYEFLDLSDVNGADLNNLQFALFQRKPDISEAEPSIGCIESTIDTLSQSTSRASPTTVSNSNSVELTGGEGEMAPHSPARGASGPPPHPPPYAQQPPTYPPPHHQWQVAPPNVYVSQVTANVNVHGYMGQYYQPPTPQYTATPQERIPRTHRRDRRTKRQPSPPTHPAQPYYVQYPQYYLAAQAQGAPLYHQPVYQPFVYGPYTYPPYYPEYPIPVEGDVDKGPEEYTQEVLMEQEAVDAYYANTHYVGPPYGPPVDGGVEYAPPMYLPPPHHPQPVQPTLHHHPQPHQFNVHAKNFVQGGRNFIPNDKVTEQRSPPASATSAATTQNVDSLPVKDLKISAKGPGSPKQNERPVADNIQNKPAFLSAEKVAPKIDSKPIVTTPTEKVEQVVGPTQPSRTFPPLTTGPNSVTAGKIQPTINKSTKSSTAPFSGGKQPAKSTAPQTIVPSQQTASTPKAPFGNRHRREGTANRSPSNEINEVVDRATNSADHPKREPPLPPSKAPMPISITLHSGGQPLIVTSKPPFGHSRKGGIGVPEPLATPQPPPPAPTASDFPPPPTPRNRTEPPPAVQSPPQPASGKSWASLFSVKSSNPAPVPAVPAPVSVEEPASPTTNTPPVATNVQKPVAKVPPYDASPLSGCTTDKQPQNGVAPLISYSEKTSVNAVSGTNAATASPKSSIPNQPVAEVKETPVVQRDTTPLAPPVPSPYCDDPNSYRMGEFLTKYQLDNRSVSILPRGLTNRSNYCYVNAILQALIACPPFYNLLKALPYQTRRGKSSTPVIDSMVELCYEFSPAGAVVRGARGGSTGAGCAGTAPIVPGGPPLDGGTGLRVLRALRPFPGSQEGRQEDAEEFLGCLLNSLNDEMLELMKLVEPEEPKDINNSQPNGIIAPEQHTEEDDDDDEWKVMGPRNRGAVERRWAARRTPVADIFRGSTRVRLHRAHHHDVTDAVQPFFTLQLDIERSSNVKDALELLAGKDTLEGVNDAWQQLSLEELPVALLLHLKCFQLDQEGHTAKIVKNIEFPIDLKIDPKVMSSKLKYTTKQRLYKLFAVVYHEGVEAVKGHYVTDTYHGQAGWIRYDDSTVTQVPESQVTKPKPPRMPYLLMYRRLDTLPSAHHRAPIKTE